MTDSQVKYIIVNSEAPFDANLRAITVGDVVYSLPNPFLPAQSVNVRNDLAAIPGFQEKVEFRIRVIPVNGSSVDTADKVLTYNYDVSMAAYFTASGTIINPVLTFKRVGPVEFSDSVVLDARVE